MYILMLDKVVKDYCIVYTSSVVFCCIECFVQCISCVLALSERFIQKDGLGTNKAAQRQKDHRELKLQLVGAHWCTNKGDPLECIQIECIFFSKRIMISTEKKTLLGLKNKLRIKLINESALKFRHSKQ